jgi:hypothetical protein
MAHVWEKSYPSIVQWDYPLPSAVPLESLPAPVRTTPDARSAERIGASGLR